MRLVFSAVVVASLCAAPVFADADNSSSRELVPGSQVVSGRHRARGHATAGALKRNPNLTYHGGPVRTVTTQIHPIFWGTQWANPSFMVDKADIHLFYEGASLSKYLGTNTEYTQSGGKHVSTQLLAGTVQILQDNSPAPSGEPSTSAILGEVCKVYGSSLTSNGYYPVYVDTPRGSAGYCAWHSAGKCTKTGVTVQFGFFFNLDGDPGCDPGGALNGHTQGLTALANVSGHEMSEMLTDPQLNAWYDASGYENSDKCAWTFGASAIVFANNTAWRIQGNWSNNAYNANQGYVDTVYYSGQKQRGCIDGTN
jgi:hypothetical protein